MVNESGNPFFKERVETPLNEKVIGFKLSDEIKEDFLKYIGLAYPNKNKALNDIILNLLNSRCIERKYFNIDVVAICPYVFDSEKLNKCLYLSSKDSYLISRNKAIKNSSSIILNNELYLNPSKWIDLEDYTNMVNNNDFTDSKIEPIDNIYMSDCILEYAYSKDYNFYKGYSLLHFKINNFLDEFINKEFQTPNRNHKGIGYYISDHDVLSFYVYEWKFKDNYEFELLDINLISEEEFKSLILNSSNDELKQFLKGFKDLSSYEEAISDVPEGSEIEELKKENMKLKLALDISENLIETLKEENQDLKFKYTNLNNKFIDIDERASKIEEALKRYGF